MEFIGEATSRPSPKRKPAMKKSTQALVTKAQAIAAIDARMAATMLANAYRAASVADQQEILAIANGSQFAGMFVSINNTLVVKG